MYNYAVCCVVTEREVECGMLQSDDATKTSFCITRCITNLMENISDSRAHKFIDIITSGDVCQRVGGDVCQRVGGDICQRVGGDVCQRVSVDVDAQQMLTSLRQDKISSVLAPDSIVHFDIEWESPGEADANEDEAYLSEVMSVFECKMLELIDQAVSEKCSGSCDSHVVELIQHLTVCRQRSQVRLSTPALYSALYIDYSNMYIL